MQKYDTDSILCCLDNQSGVKITCFSRAEGQGAELKTKRETRVRAEYNILCRSTIKPLTRSWVFKQKTKKTLHFNTKTQIVNQESKIIIQFATISCLKDLAYTYISCIRYDVHYVCTLAIAMLLHFMPDISRWRNEYNLIKIT